MRIDKLILALALVPGMLLCACLGPQTTGPSTDGDGKSDKEMVSDVNDTEYGKDAKTDGTVATGPGTVLAKRASDRSPR